MLRYQLLVSQSFTHGDINFEHAALTNYGIASAAVHLVLAVWNI